MNEEETTIKAATRLVSAEGSAASPEYGYKWDVQVIDAGPDKQGLAIYPLDVLHAAAPVYEGAKVFALSQGQHDNPDRPFGKSVRDLVGWLSSVKANNTGLEAKLNISKTASWLRDMVVDAWDRGKQDLVGLSHDVQALVASKTPPARATKIIRVDSVDIVYDPIAGGKFLRMAAAARKAAGQKEADMFKQLLAALLKQRPDLKTQIEALEAKGDTVTEEEMTALISTMTGARQTAKDEVKDLLTKLQASMTESSTKQAQELVDKATAKFAETQKLLACATQLVDELEASKLPDILKTRVRQEFSGKAFELADLQAAIKSYKELHDKLAPPAIEGVGGLRTEVGQEEPEKLQAAFDKMLGADVDEKFKDVVAFRSLRAAYARLTGDDDLRGVPSREGMKLGQAFMEMMRLPAAYSTSSFSFVLGNAMYRRLIKEYNAVNYQEDVLISYFRNAENFKTMEIIQVGYFDDIPTVNPELADYVELDMPTDIEATYAMIQKGGILTVTRATMLADDIRSVIQLVSKVGRAARRTHAKRAWNKIIDNATYKGDSTNLFDSSDHGNLGSVALTLDSTGIATLTNRIQAMYVQKEQDSGETLGLIPKYLWCDRTHLEIAKGLNSAWPGASAPNPHAGAFGPAHERIICNPLFTDTNDWGLIADANDVELLEAAYMNGRREPEFFLADNPVVGQMFVADKIQYKVRHEYEVEIADWRGFDKSVVSP